MPDKKETAVKKPRQNQYEYSRRKGDGKWVKWELISDVDLGLMDLYTPQCGHVIVRLCNLLSLA